MHRKLIVFAALLVGVGCWAQDEKPFAVLPASEAHNVTRLCSRTGPEKIDDGWVPDKRDIASLEARLSEITNVTSGRGARTTISDPRRSYRQYVGIVVGGRRLIYVNAFPSEFKDWKTHFLGSICDGGSALWGVLFDPATGTFSDLETNGEA